MAQKVIKNFEGSISDGSINTSMMSSGITQAFFTTISNDHATESLTVRYNSVTGDAMTLKAGETLEDEETNVTAIFFTNQSGQAIPYRIWLRGSL